MELDDLKTTWKSIDRRLEMQNNLQLRIYRDGKLDKARTNLRPLFAGQILQIICGALLVAVSALFWTSHRQELHLMLSGLTMHAYGILLIIFGARTALLIKKIDYAAPVVTIQRELAQLRSFFIRSGMAIGLVWWLLWIPMMTMIFGFLGADLVRNAPSVIYVGSAVGIAGLGFTYWLYHWSRHPDRPHLAKIWNESVTGKSLLKTQRFLDEIAQFERE